MENKKTSISKIIKSEIINRIIWNRLAQIIVNQRYKKGDFKIPIHLAMGHEAIAVAVDYSMEDGDSLFLTHRNIHYNLARSKTLAKELDEYYLRDTGIGRGYCGSMNMRNADENIVYTSSILGNNLSGNSFNFGPMSQYSHTVERLLQDLSKYWNIQDSSGAYQITDEIKFHEAGLLKLNCDKALFHLKWLPTLSYEQLIEFTGAWYYNYYKKQGNMLDYTFEQVNKYEKIAFDKELQWTK